MAKKIEPTLHSVHLDLGANEVDHRILLDDGDIDTGYSFVGLSIIPVSNAAIDIRGIVVHTQPNGAAIVTAARFDINRNDQVGFAYMDGTSGVMQTYIKADTVIVQDLFLTNLSGLIVNIELLFVRSDIGASGSIISLLRERSQGEPT
jgi:hypothetical protein